MAASAPGTSSETDATYWRLVRRCRADGEHGGRGHQRRTDRSPDGRALAGLGDGDHLDGVTGHQGHRRHLVALHQHADHLFTRRRAGVWSTASGLTMTWPA